MSGGRQPQGLDRATRSTFRACRTDWPAKAVRSRKAPSRFRYARPGEARGKGCRPQTEGVGTERTPPQLRQLLAGKASRHRDAFVPNGQFRADDLRSLPGTRESQGRRGVLGDLPMRRHHTARNSETANTPTDPEFKPRGGSSILSQPLSPDPRRSVAEYCCRGQSRLRLEAHRRTWNFALS